VSSNRPTIDMKRAAELLGVTTRELAAACEPGSQTFDEYLATCPRVSISAVARAEAARLGKDVDSLTDEEFRPAFLQAAWSAIQAG